jgi:capsular exopolysaccharide synthesis family protein
MSLSMRLIPPYSDEEAKQTILVTSSQPHEGKTTIAQGLSEVLAQRNIAVALIDADMRVLRTPRRGRALPAVGLGDVLRRSVTLDNVVTKRSGVSIITSGSSSSNPGALIASKSMAQLVASLHATHDVVIIDGPPALVGGDVYALSRLASRILFVIKQSDTTERQVEEALAAVDKSAEDIGVVLNMVRTTGDADDELAFSPRMMEYYTSSAPYLPKA